MQTQCTAGQLEFEGIGSRQVVGAFDSGRTSSDGGLMLLRELEQRRPMLDRFAACFRDLRSAQRIEHSVVELIRQRVLALACGYEDLNDHDTLRHDALLALAQRIAVGGRGSALCGGGRSSPSRGPYTRHVSGRHVVALGREEAGVALVLDAGLRP